MKKIINSKKKVENNFDELYVNLYNSEEKRKNLLYCIKNSLIMQDEHEKIIEIRKEKNKILNEIKLNLSKVSNEYQKLKKVLPNVKNVLSYTEKELEELDLQIKTFKKTIDKTKEEIQIDENLKSSIISGKIKHIPENKEEIKEPIKKIIPEKKIQNKPQSNSRLDRIKNNLKVIESKLNNL